MASEEGRWSDSAYLHPEFPPTAWGDLREASAVTDPARQRESLERICRAYLTPIYTFIRRRGHDRATAQDLTQDFFHHLLRKELLKLADQKRGRFRSFIQKSLSNFLASDWDRRCAQKRDERLVISLDESLDEGGLGLEPATGESPDREFDRNWATRLLGIVRARLESDLRRENKKALLALLPLAIHEDEETPYARIATELWMSEAAVKKAIERLRARWEQVLREEVAATVQSPEEVEAELRELYEVLEG